MRTLLICLPLALAAACNCPPDDGGPSARMLFAPDSLEGWEKCNYAGIGEIEMLDGGVLRIGAGETLSGVRYTGEVPRVNYEVTVRGRKIEGDDFFFCLTYPFKEKHASFVLGGWGGSVCGISSIDYMDAMDNTTMTVREFEEGRWYDIRFVVTDHRFQGFIDGEPVVNINVEGRDVDMRFGEIEESIPFAISSFCTTGEYKDMQLRELSGEEIAAAQKLDEEDEFY